MKIKAKCRKLTKEERSVFRCGLDDKTRATLLELYDTFQIRHSQYGISIEVKLLPVDNRGKKSVIWIPATVFCKTTQEAAEQAIENYETLI